MYGTLNGVGDIYACIFKVPFFFGFDEVMVIC